MPCSNLCCSDWTCFTRKISDIGKRNRLMKGWLSVRDLRRFRWLDLEDLVGDHKLWPKKVKRKIWKRSIGHFDRMIICSFAFVNGLLLDALLKFVKAVNPQRNPSEYREVVSLLTKLAWLA